jgi:fatty acid desaturase
MSPQNIGHLEHHLSEELAFYILLQSQQKIKPHEVQLQSSVMF